MSETLGDVLERSREDDLGSEESRNDESVEIKREEEEEVSDNKLVFEICRKRKRSDDEQEEEDHVEEEENDGFKTPTRPENRIPEMKECPWAPKRPEYSEMFRGKTTRPSCRRRLSFSPEDSVVNSFISDLQWRTTTTTIKK
ncbi:hypothetical protein AALP_AA4G152600 [Arabis alpina]|uniref:Uncharacterized protein n=1 Tax=Arabis alpina TaxID=50452 RepID=A0A087H3F0_ARAAL|nr:hypothetical protein AALP_AA4G152600 [Arabis alpina]